RGRGSRSRRRRGGGHLGGVLGGRPRGVDSKLPRADHRAAERVAHLLGSAPVRRLLPAFIGVLSFVVFIPALAGEFLTWDDDINLVSNPFYRGLGLSQIRWAFSNVRMGHYIPVTWLGLSANYAAGGMNPWGYHLVNVILHAANAVAFYFVARRLLAAARDGGRQDRRAEPALAWGAAVAALVFALHPLRAESVAWITERRDVQSGFFYLMA